MELKDTVEGMLSDDYRERFKAEYRQTVIRRDKLAKMLDDYLHGRLNFKPKARISALTCQLDVLREYVGVLELRAIQEGIKINDDTI